MTFLHHLTVRLEICNLFHFRDPLYRWIAHDRHDVLCNQKWKKVDVSSKMAVKDIMCNPSVEGVTKMEEGYKSEMTLAKSIRVHFFYFYQQIWWLMMLCAICVLKMSDHKCKFSG